MELSDHLFRREAGRMVAVLTRIFGVHNMALAEDVVQDAFCRAMDVWPFQGVPDNPSAWLMATAKRRAIDVLRREHTAQAFAPALSAALDEDGADPSILDACFETEAIVDDQLRMMFTCCHPRLPETSQVALMLNVLCGFSVAEVAHAFVETHTAVEKRIVRAKHVLASLRHVFDVDIEADVERRLPVVHRAIYLLFNHGYHGASPESAVRIELCQEAMRLIALLQVHPRMRTPATNALAALCCLHAARLPGRLDDAGAVHPLGAQDRTLWDRAMIKDGLELLDRSARGRMLTEYHVEAAIAAVHAEAPALAATDWVRIVELYDMLMAIRPSPVVALHRAIAIGERDGPEHGLAAIAAIERPDRLARYPFYSAALGELELRRGAANRAHTYFLDALSVARNETERQFFRQRIETVLSVGNPTIASPLPSPDR